MSALKTALRTVVGALVAASTTVSAFAADPPAFIPIDRVYLPLPSGVYPALPTFTADGADIVFQNFADGAVWIVGRDGADPHCITCGFPDTPRIPGGFVYAFPDGKRLLLTKGLGQTGGGDKGAKADAWVVECAVSLRDCASHKILPVDFSADRGSARIIHRRTWHLAPDGVHLGWMNVRSDGTVMIVARLERQADQYAAVDPRAVNPVGPVSSADPDPERWENLSQLYELKSFTPDGLGILAVGMPNNNVDVLRIGLADGRVERLTANPDWDEDTSLSPDQRLMVVNSWRPRQRLDALAWLPQVRGFTGLMFGAAIAPLYVSTWTGFQCDLSPWLLSAQGDDGGRLLGQPLDTYSDDLTAGNNVAGQQTWSPDSTLVILQERTRLPPPAPPTPNRLALARLGRPAAAPVPIRPSVVGPWATPAAAYAGPNAVDRAVTVKGRAGGSARISYSGALDTGAATSVTFDRYSDDGATFVDGEMAGRSTKGVWRLTADVQVSGAHVGRTTMDLTINNSARPLPTRTGTIFSVYDGKVAPPLPKLGACYADLPKPSPLSLRLDRRGQALWASVTANVYGDVRPVMNATVRWGRLQARTDAKGVARLTGAGGRGPVTASAGDTFLPISRRAPR
ncbi:hypothetical protein [Caulobacter radicis]|nr:hypothetical protein [Caulobacter radicis]